MIKTVFIDYTGTMVKEGGKEMEELVARVCKGSSMKEPAAVVGLWWKLVKEYETKSFQDSYLTEDQITEKVLWHMEREIHLKENTKELHRLVQGFWLHAPLFADVKPFLEQCPVPVYVISNNGKEYVTKALKEKGIILDRVICADMVRAYKPHKELFEKGLEISGCKAQEAVHIGDSYASDVQGARSAKITPILLDRSGTKHYGDVRVIQTLTEALDLWK